MAKIKKKSLFDHVNAVTSQQHPNYWDEISDDDKKSWSNYIKGDKKMKYPKWVYEIVSKHLQCSIREAGDAVDMFELSAGGQSELTDILMKYGKTEDECRKIGL